MGMRPDDMYDLVRAEPFRPFRITLTDGRVYEVKHPELAVVGRSVFYIFYPRPQARKPIAEEFVQVSLLHIMQVEPLPESEAG